MQWQLHDAGFLPVHDPVTKLRDAPFAPIEQLGVDLPRLVYERRFLNECTRYLPSSIEWDRRLPTLTEPEIERLFKLFSYFASAYIHAPGLPGVNRLPAPLAGPLVRLSQRLERPPILAYASYCLHNWRRINTPGPIELGNIELLQNFSMPGDGKSDEDWFILVHVDIEARAGKALRAMRDAQAAIGREDAQALQSLLEATAGSLHAMNKTLDRMPEGCSADVYFRKVRPYIFGFNGVMYEGCFGDAPQTYRGETGAQSSIIPTLLQALGICHQNTLLTQHLADMQKYMPAPHRQFIRAQVSVRDFVVRDGGAGLRDRYNACIAEVIAFRSRHFEYALNYIEKKVDNPIATGGTPYIPWLRQLIEETKQFYIA